MKWKLSESRTLTYLPYWAPEGAFPPLKFPSVIEGYRNEADLREDFIWCTVVLMFPDFPSQGSPCMLPSHLTCVPAVEFTLLFSANPPKSRYPSVFTWCCSRKFWEIYIKPVRFEFQNKHPRRALNWNSIKKYGKLQYWLWGIYGLQQHFQKLLGLWWHLCHNCWQRWGCRWVLHWHWSVLQFVVFAVAEIGCFYLITVFPKLVPPPKSPKLHAAHLLPFSCPLQRKDWGTKGKDGLG